MRQLIEVILSSIKRNPTIRIVRLKITDLKYLVNMIFQSIRRVELLLASFAIRTWVNFGLFDQDRPPQPAIARMAWMFGLKLNIHELWIGYFQYNLSLTSGISSISSGCNPSCLRSSSCFLLVMCVTVLLRSELRWFIHSGQTLSLLCPWFPYPPALSIFLT